MGCDLTAASEKQVLPLRYAQGQDDNFYCRGGV